MISGNDAAGGFDEAWCEMIGFNNLIAAPGTKEMIEAKISYCEEHSDGNIHKPLDTVFTD